MTNPLHCRHCSWDHPAHKRTEQHGHRDPCPECHPQRGMHEAECDLLDLVQGLS